MQHKKDYLYYLATTTLLLLSQSQHAACKANTTAKSTPSFTNAALVDWAIQQDTMHSTQDLASREASVVSWVPASLSHEADSVLASYNRSKAAPDTLATIMQRGRDIPAPLPSSIEAQLKAPQQQPETSNFVHSSGKPSHNFAGTTELPKHQGRKVPLTRWLHTVKHTATRQQILSEDLEAILRQKTTARGVAANTIALKSFAKATPSQGTEPPERIERGGSARHMPLGQEASGKPANDTALDSPHSFDVTIQDENIADTALQYKAYITRHREILFALIEAKEIICYTITSLRIFCRNAAEA